MAQANKTLTQVIAEKLKTIDNAEGEPREAKTFSQHFAETKVEEKKKPLRKPIQTKTVFTVPYEGHNVTMFEIIPDYHEVEDDLDALMQAVKVLYPFVNILRRPKNLRPNRERLYGFDYRGRTRALIFTDIPVRGVANFYGQSLPAWETIFRRITEFRGYNMRAHFKELTSMRSPATDNIKTALISVVLTGLDQLNADPSDENDCQLVIATINAKSSLTYDIEGDTTTVRDEVLHMLTRLPAPKKEYVYH